MGWNALTFLSDQPKWTSWSSGEYVYFVHSFYAKTSEEYLVATTEYDVTIPAIVQRNKVIGMQFHPEKSGEVGLRLLQTVKEMIR